MESLLKTAEEFYEKYEKHISSFALVAGFIFDNLTIQRIDKLFDHIVIISYLIISGGSIALLNYYKENSPKKIFFVRTRDILPFLIQFAFGGLFSVFFVFYVRSAALSSSWPFMLFLLSLLIGNEFFREYYQRMAFQVSIYFVAVFSFFILVIPVLLKTMSAAIFMLSGFVSLIFIFLFSRTLFRVVPARFKDSRKNLRNSIGSIFIIINILYFSNLIPPVPLAMKNAGVYYSVERMGESYKVIGEKEKWYERLPFFIPETIHLKAGSPLYVFSSVFAPTDLDTKIIHDWQYFNDVTEKWVSATQITFPIKGGRDQGYRGFSRKESLFAGEWRVDVKTERGQIIGRVKFNIITQPSEAEFEDRIL